ncbi:MAG: hypothetical protein B1H13_13200, partial [Desulfobacteraceae bacterium 4484_190.3]
MNKNQVEKVIEDLKCRIITRKSDYCVIEVTGTEEDIDRILKHFEPLGIEDMSRS